MNVYIAGAFESQARLRDLRDRIEALGSTVIGTWLDEEGSGTPTFQDALGYAVRDLSEVRVADLLILDTLDVNERGGREVEYGAAFAWGIPTVRVGPARNVFHQLQKEYPDWDTLLAAEWLREGG